DHPATHDPAAATTDHAGPAPAADLPGGSGAGRFGRRWLSRTARADRGGIADLAAATSTPTTPGPARSPDRRVRLPGPGHRADHHRERAGPVRTPGAAL